MADVINSNAVFVDKKFIDLAGLDYFWEQAKKYVDDADKVLSDRLDGVDGEIDALQTAVGNSESGLVKEVAQLRSDVDALGGAEGGIQGMIDASIEALKLPETYDAIGSAAAAETAAKSHADGLNTAMDTRVKVLEEIDHQKIVDDAINDFATKVSNDDVVNTYKELIDYAAEHGSEFTELVGVVATKAEKTYVDGLDEAMGTRVKALEDHKDDYVAADSALETSLKSYADGKASAAESAAKAYTDELANGAVKANTDAIAIINGADSVEGSIAKAKADAIKAAQDKIDALKLSETYDAKGAAAQALVDAKQHVADTISGLDLPNTYDAKGSAATAQAAAQAYAQAYTDALYDSIEFASNGDIDGLFTTVEA
jgi:hypothetical protein